MEMVESLGDVGLCFFDFDNDLPQMPTQSSGHVAATTACRGVQRRAIEEN